MIDLHSHALPLIDDGSISFEQSLEMISYNMNLLQSTRIVPGNNYTKNAGQWNMTASQTGMFDAKQ